MKKLGLEPGKLYGGVPEGDWNPVQINNLCVWWNGSLVIKKGHKGACRWRFDGQFWIHKPVEINYQYDTYRLKKIMEERKV